MRFRNTPAYVSLLIPPPPPRLWRHPQQSTPGYINDNMSDIPPDRPPGSPHSQALQSQITLPSLLNHRNTPTNYSSTRLPQIISSDSSFSFDLSYSTLHPPSWTTPHQDIPNLPQLGLHLPSPPNLDHLGDLEDLGDLGDLTDLASYPHSPHFPQSSINPIDSQHSTNFSNQFTANPNTKTTTRSSSSRPPKKGKNKNVRRVARVSYAEVPDTPAFDIGAGDETGPLVRGSRVDLPKITLPDNLPPPLTPAHHTSPPPPEPKRARPIKHTCLICRADLLSKASLDKHKKFQHNCPYCSVTCSSASDVISHIEASHQHQCQLCLQPINPSFYRSTSHKMKQSDQTIMSHPVAIHSSILNPGHNLSPPTAKETEIPSITPPSKPQISTSLPSTQAPSPGLINDSQSSPTIPSLDTYHDILSIPDELPIHAIVRENDVTKLMNFRCYELSRTTSSSSMTPLHTASMAGAEESLSYLLRHISPNLVNQRDTHGDSPLSHAARLGRINCIVPLINAGACLLSRNVLGRTPFHLSAYMGHHSSLAYLIGRFDNSPIPALLLSDNFGRTALHLACIEGHTSVVDCLLLHGAMNRITDYETQTPADLARLNFHFTCLQALSNVTQLPVPRWSRPRHTDPLPAHTDQSGARSPPDRPPSSQSSHRDHLHTAQPIAAEDRSRCHRRCLACF